MDDDELTEGLLEARDQRGVIRLPSDLDLERAYRVGAQVDRKLRARGFRAVGYKVGFTNPRVWARWGLDDPVLFPIYNGTVTEVKDGCPVTLAPYRAPRLEVEVVFGVSPGSRPRPAWVAIGLEIVDCHEGSWQLTPAGSVADFGLHGLLVVGQRVTARDPGFDDALNRLDELEVSLWREGDANPAVTGEGRHVLGHPLSVLAVLPRLVSYFDPVHNEIEDGLITVSTGTMTPLVSCNDGETWRVSASSAGSPPLAGFDVTLCSE